MHVSVLMPAFNEAPNLREIVPRTVEVLQREGHSFEVVVVDDGSNDGTRGVMADLVEELPAVHYLRLGRNYGKSTALQSGFKYAAGQLVVLMDADGQDDPSEIPRLIEALDGGLDLVTGRRSVRNDRFVKRTTSKLYNRATSLITGVEGRDFNSGLKAMRRSVMESVELYGDLHRYIPVLAQWAGFRVGEVDVEHHSRLHGHSKFGRARYWRGFLDLLTVKFLTTYTSRPFHLFGGVGFLLGVAGGALLGWMAVLKLLGEGVGQRPALLAGILLLMVAVQLMSLGLMAEMLVHLRAHREPFVEVTTRTAEPVAPPVQRVARG